MNFNSSQPKQEMFQLLNGDVKAWIEQETIHMIAIDGRDPVELTQGMARKLSVALVEMTNQLDGKIQT
jgi:hypothetical protein